MVKLTFCFPLNNGQEKRNGKKLYTFIIECRSYRISTTMSMRSVQVQKTKSNNIADKSIGRIRGTPKFFIICHRNIRLSLEARLRLEATQADLKAVSLN